MKKRVRKKLHLGEFARIGFRVEWQTRESIKDDDVFAFLDTVIDWVEGIGVLCWAGQWHIYGHATLYSAKRYGKLTEQHREAMTGYLESALCNGTLSAYRVSHLADFSGEPTYDKELN